VITPLPFSRWNEQTAAHLLNRAGFGGTPEEIEALRRKGLTLAVRELVEVNLEASSPSPPDWARPKNIQELRRSARAATDPARKKEKMRELRMMEEQQIIDLRRWWLERMMNGPAPLLEKMTLFWHGHFATSIQKVKDVYWMWLQNDTLRRNALGNFAALTKQMSRDPAMMIYLDLQQSRKAHPNENWARELMELFTVGIGNYSEQDIREAARAFTGYRIDPTDQQFRFEPNQQDRGNKQFMGRTGFLSGDDIIDTLVKQPACARFIGRKLWRFFVEDDPAPVIVEALAERIRAHNFEMRPVLRELFNSAEFYSDRVMRAQIKSPVQFMVQTAKILDAPLPAPMVAQNSMRQMGQILFAPPNVKGWDGGKSWITTSTLLFRYNFANYLLNGDAMLPGGGPPRGPRFGGGIMAALAQRDPVEMTRLAPAELRGKPRELVDFVAARLFQHRPSQKEAGTFVQYLEAREPDTGDATMRGLVHLMMSTPQFQLT
jgi:uncharacterized protein (DUF1800 family)